MKFRTILSSVTLFCSLTFIPLNTWAQGTNVGNGGGGGEPTFIYYRDLLIQWISMGVLNIDTKASLRELNWDELVQTMKNTPIQFTANDLLVVGNSLDRVCKNYPNTDAALRKIECNLSEWKKLPQKDQFALVFHEYLGLLGYESNSGDFSNYPLSSQIIGILSRENGIQTEAISIDISNELHSVPEPILKYVLSQQTKHTILKINPNGSLSLENLKMTTPCGKEKSCEPWFSPSGLIRMEGAYLKNGHYQLEINVYGSGKGEIGGESFRFNQKGCPPSGAVITWNEKHGILSITGITGMCLSVVMGRDRVVERKGIESDGSISIEHVSENIFDTHTRYVISVNGIKYRNQFIKK